MKQSANVEERGYDYGFREGLSPFQPSFNPNTIRFLLSPSRREQEPDCVWVERRGRRMVSSDILIF